MIILIIIIIRMINSSFFFKKNWINELFWVALLNVSSWKSVLSSNLLRDQTNNYNPFNPFTFRYNAVICAFHRSIFYEQNRTENLPFFHSNTHNIEIFYSKKYFFQNAWIDKKKWNGKVKKVFGIAREQIKNWF